MPDVIIEDENLILVQLALDAVHVQNACNPRAIINELPKVMAELDRLGQFTGHESVKNHPIMIAWVDKLRELFGIYDSNYAERVYSAHKLCQELAGISA